MKLVVCQGEGSNFSILEPDGIKRPYHVVTMDELWWEAAAELGLPRLFFKSALRMMNFCLCKDTVIAVVVKDGTVESGTVAASYYAMGAVTFDIYPN